HRIQFKSASANHAEDRQPESAHQHSCEARKNVAIVPVGLKNLQSSMRNKQQPNSEKNEIGAQVKQTKPSFVHCLNLLPRTVPFHPFHLTVWGVVRAAGGFAMIPISHRTARRGMKRFMKTRTLLSPPTSLTTRPLSRARSAVCATSSGARLGSFPSSP